MIKALVVGRHAGEIPDVEIVWQENVKFALDRKLCADQIVELAVMAHEKGADALIFQNTPGIVTAALGSIHRSYARADDYLPFKHPRVLGIEVGVIVSYQDEESRQAGVSKTWKFNHDDCGYDAMQLARFVNGRVTVSNNFVSDGMEVTVTLDPVKPFVFHHVEWL